MEGFLTAIAPNLFNVGGWLAVGAFVLVSAIRGWFIPNSQVERLIKAYEKIIESKDKQIDNLTQAFNNSDARADILAENQRTLVESVNTTNNLIQALITSTTSREPTR